MKIKKGITIGKTRSALYKAARFLGDVNSVKRGTIGQRLIRTFMFEVVRLRSSSMPSKCTTFQLNFSNTHSLCITESVSTGT